MQIDDIPLGRTITVAEIRRSGLCVAGQRRWFEDRGYDFRLVIRDGIDARELYATEDALAQRAVATILNGF